MEVTHVSEDGVVSFKGCMKSGDSDAWGEFDLVKRLRDERAIKTPLGRVVITSLEKEDGSGRSWNYRGLLFFPGVEPGAHGIPVKGCYREAGICPAHGHIQIAA